MTSQQTVQALAKLVGGWGREASSQSSDVQEVISGQNRFNYEGDDIETNPKTNTKNSQCPQRMKSTTKTSTEQTGEAHTVTLQHKTLNWLSVPRRRHESEHNVHEGRRAIGPNEQQHIHRRVQDLSTTSKTKTQYPPPIPRTTTTNTPSMDCTRIFTHRNSTNRRPKTTTDRQTNRQASSRRIKRQS